MELVERAEQLYARENGSRGSTSIHAGEVIAEYLNGLRSYRDALIVQGTSDTKLVAWVAIVEAARSALDEAEFMAAVKELTEATFYYAGQGYIGNGADAKKKAQVRAANAAYAMRSLLKK